MTNHPHTVNHAILLFILTLALLAGCSSTRAPKMQITGAEITQRSDEAAVVSFTMELQNHNAQPLPLRNFNYSLSVDGKTVFHAKRSAELTLPQHEKSTLTLPAVIPFNQLTGGFNGTHTYRIFGQLTYSAPGAFAEVLLDMHFPPPSTSFTGSAQVDSTIP